MIKGFQKADGFSLIETLVATFVFALVSASAVAILTGYQNSQLRLQEADSQLASLDRARALMRADFFAAFNRPVRDEFGGTMVAFEGGPHMSGGIVLRLVRGGSPTAKLFGNRSALQRVEYIVLDGSLYRRLYDRTDIVTTTEVIDQHILPGVRSISARYGADGLWVEDWGTLPSSSRLPRLAEIDIVFGSGDSVKMMFLVGKAT